MLGKRKRAHQVVGRSMSVKNVQDNARDQDNSREIFRQYFEAQFQPLQEETTSWEQNLRDGEGMIIEGDEEEEEVEEDVASDWNGLSGDEHDPPTVPVVEYQTLSPNNNDEADLREVKSFMGSKPPLPSSVVSSIKVAHARVQPAEDPAADAADLKNDLALQRLLKESHLFEKAKTSDLLDAHRHRAVDMRLQSLGSKLSLYKQEKMPLSHRRGMTAKAAFREDRRRQDAQENGIILERASKLKKMEIKRRDRSIGGPAVGKFAGGTLRLSRKDVSNIQGPSRVQRGRKRGRQ